MVSYMYTNIGRKINSLENQVSKVVRQKNVYHNKDPFQQPSYDQNPQYCESIINLLQLTQNLKQDLLRSSLNTNPFDKHSSYMYDKICVLESELNNLVRSIRPMKSIDNRSSFFVTRSYQHLSALPSRRKLRSDYIVASSNHVIRKPKRENPTFMRPDVKLPPPYARRTDTSYFENVPSKHMIVRRKSSDIIEEVSYYYWSSSSDVTEVSSSSESDDAVPIYVKKNKVFLRRQPSFEIKKSPRKSVKKIVKKKKPKSSTVKFGVYKSEPNLKSETSTPNVQIQESEVFLVKKKQSPEAKVNKNAKRDRFFISRLKKVKSSSSSGDLTGTEQHDIIVKSKKSQKPNIDNEKKRNNERKHSRSRFLFSKHKDDKNYHKSRSKANVKVHNDEPKTRRTSKIQNPKSKKHLQPKRKYKEEPVVIAYSYISDTGTLGTKNSFSKAKPNGNIFINLTQDHFTQTSCHENIGERARRPLRGGSESINGSRHYTNNSNGEFYNSAHTTRNSSKGIYEGHEYNPYFGDTYEKNKKISTKNISNAINDANYSNPTDIVLNRRVIGNSKLFERNVFLLKIDENNSLPVLLENHHSGLKSKSRLKTKTSSLDSGKIKEQNFQNNITDPFGKTLKTTPIYVATVQNFEEINKTNSSRNNAISNHVSQEGTFLPKNKNFSLASTDTINYKENQKVVKKPDTLDRYFFNTLISEGSQKSKPNSLSLNDVKLKSENKLMSSGFLPKIPLVENSTTVYQVKEEENIKSLSRIWPASKSISAESNKSNKNIKHKKKSLSRIWPLTRSKSKTKYAENNDTNPPQTQKKTSSKITRLFSRSNSKTSAASKDGQSLINDGDIYKNISNESLQSKELTKKDRQKSKKMLKKTLSQAKRKEAKKSKKKSKAEKKEVSDDKTGSVVSKSGKSKNVLKRLFSRGKLKSSKSADTDIDVASKVPRSVSGYFGDLTPVSSGSIVTVAQPLESSYEQDQKPDITRTGINPNLSKQSKLKSVPKTEKSESCQDGKHLNYSLHYTKEKHRCVELDSVPSDLTLCEPLPLNCKTLWSKDETALSEHNYQDVDKHHNFHEIYIFPKYSSKCSAERAEELCKSNQEPIRSRNQEKYFDRSNFVSANNNVSYFRKVPITISCQDLSDCSSCVDWQKIASQIKDCT